VVALLFPGFRELFRKRIFFECNQVGLKILLLQVKCCHLTADVELILTVCPATIFVVALLLL